MYQLSMCACILLAAPFEIERVAYHGFAIEQLS
jgi:hypothetical protein